MTESQINLLIDFHADAKRLGPGCDQESLRALYLSGLDMLSTLNVADIGCGTGSSSLMLGQYLTQSNITAVDLFPEFLAKLSEQAKSLRIDKRIQTKQADMAQADLFAPNSLDLIWSEGAIYNLGFEAGIKAWKGYLKQNGIIAVSEITWLREERPDEINAYWQKNYPQVDTASGKIKVLEEQGFTILGYFPLSQHAWLDNYYQPMLDRFDDFLERNNHSEAAKALVESEKTEIDLYQRFKDYYSYGFYIAQKN